MVTTLVMPQMGYDMQEGRVVRWLKGEGESVSRGEDVAEIETDKAVVPMPATAAGVLRKILVQEGVTVPVGQVIGVVAEPGESLPQNLDELTPKETHSPTTPPEDSSTTVDTTVKRDGPTRELRVSPVARRLAQEKGIDLAQVTGSGPNGRITERDVLSYGESVTRAPELTDVNTATTPNVAVPSKTEPQIVQLSRMRQAIARLTTRSKQEIPHFYVTASVDMGAAMSLRQDLNNALEARGVRVSVNDLIIKSCAIALGIHSTLNASFSGGALELHSGLNIGVAIDLEGRGLIVPAILGCQDLSLVDIAVASRDLAERAREDRLRSEEYSEATFSVSNLGMFDVDGFTAIIHPPHSAVLAVGSVRQRPIVREGQVVVGQVMQATLSVDHRVADGAGAARFLGEVKRLLEHPGGLLV